MTEQQNQFFATQIIHKNHNKDHYSPINEIEKQERLDENNKLLQSDKKITTTTDLIKIFNQYDSQEQGIIKLNQAIQILQQRSLPIGQINQYHQISQPLYPNKVTFDELLFIIKLCQHENIDYENKINSFQKTNHRWVNFLKLLNGYRKKCQKNNKYNLAIKPKNKIEELRRNQWKRSKNYLQILHKEQLNVLEQNQKMKFINFCENWDGYMNEYERTVGETIKKLKQKQQIELKEYKYKNQEQLSSKMHYSKHIIELQTKQKNLVKLQKYDGAMKIQNEMKSLKIKETKKKKQENQEILQLRISALIKQQEFSMNNLLQKVQKDRNDQMKQRKIDSEKLIIRNKTLITELNHRHTDAVKKLYESLHSINLQ